MKRLTNSLLLACVSAILALAPSEAFAKKKPVPPEVTFDGLHRVQDSKADLVYLLPDVDLSGYTKIILLEPKIAFRKGWKSDQNSNATPGGTRVSDRDMERMIEKGKDLFMDEFTKVLNKKGYPVVHTAEGDVLFVTASIINLDIYAPDPDRTAGIWTKTFTDGAGYAALVLEVYDSTSGQILARAVDSKGGKNKNHSWTGASGRTQSTNIRDARSAFASWAKMIANGLDRVKDAKLAEE